eukprot:365065-Chlamydomonas_euryale.AAC.8
MALKLRVGGSAVRLQRSQSQSFRQRSYEGYACVKDRRGQQNVCLSACQAAAWDFNCLQRYLLRWRPVQESLRRSMLQGWMDGRIGGMDGWVGWMGG